ncbi:hypothetical protein TRFO_32352 [Tritrichomonas foetus]|uniref:UBA domain-containing protein n=1 Tax=Tritrichomonas foetus TaxID=1144522 RepID=A0A1J4JP04_9EUKA|nr:hypothetical protein TRFO_32352 [Tritrichomonas foetus]|eukprot:OHT00879.1 hypothetical protein TRFO_32352 [Tritrichomonas foetus]
MLSGDFWIDGAPSQCYFLFIVPIFTFIIWLIELQTTTEKYILIIHILFCWNSIFEGFFMSFIIWSLRNIERIVGFKSFRNFMIYNWISYLPFCILINFLTGIETHLPMNYFYPFGLFSFMLYYIPSQPIFLILTDKCVLTLAFILDIIVYLPYSLVPVVTGAVGTAMWSYDVFHLGRCATEPLEISDDYPNSSRRRNRNRRHNNRNHNTNTSNNRTHHQHHQPQQQQSLLDIPIPEDIEDRNNIHENDPEIRESDVHTITEMGFDEQHARTALIRSRNNIQNALDMLLSGHLL